ncbi:hypothetical protein PGUG_00511 [Meyerozyma guilliermondii ATCC 6260]|uniref:DNA primase n=1 Tax=Meyerozyma guilliermondii (strain ATCC 6260 / CBS 566 / DSM 6381 / JCM 1539 / NBRC 10279 / NRRL Y-324) TaxID=294746 RepID=A5DB56_PICGU|nr:uncharacterized protein PGUG_00511 [Meyerozyma guilliermondii ATCC 6260]EDK36413.2 hypothetical protein PGUG_00511 [Meyerozyma guilliermondii ATCC 6260]
MTVEAMADPVPSQAAVPADSGVSSSDMLFFYQRLLPFRQIFQWLNHSPKPSKDFTMREFAYEYRTGAYQRYNSFSNLEEFKKSVVQANPTRFEVGAVYSVNPKERKRLPKQALKPLAKELVFDIDLTDYDEIRTCCSGTDICKKCWRFIQVAIKILDAALREDFGFNRLIWVFSGRRGAHCWVSDARARCLDETTRKSIVEYLDVLGSRSNRQGKNSLSLKRPFHPHVERSFDLLKNEFVDIILKEQDPWNTSSSEPSDKSWEQVETLLSYVPEKPLQEELRRKWKSQTSVSTSMSKWEDITVIAKKILKHQNQVNALNEAKKDIILFYMYPRLDIEVSKQLIHLLKSPFCVHPSTGNICVPFDPHHNLSNNEEDDDYGFNPTNAPNLRQLQNEIEVWDVRRVNRDSSQPLEDGESEADKRISEYEKTSLKPYVEYFQKFVNNLLKDELKDSGKRGRDDDTLEF